MLPLYWLARMVRGLEEEDLKELSEEEEQEFWEDVTEEDLEDPEPWPVLVSGIGGKTLCFFSSKERVWEMADRFYKVNLVHPITGDPITMDEFASSQRITMILSHTAHASANSTSGTPAR